MIFEIGTVALFFAFKHWQKEDAKKPPPLTPKQICLWVITIVVLLGVLWLI